MLYFSAPDSSSSSSGEVGKQFSALQNQVSVLVNMVVATLSAFGIGYYFGSYFSLNSTQVAYYLAYTAIIHMVSRLLINVISNRNLSEYGIGHWSRNSGYDNRNDIVYPTGVSNEELKVSFEHSQFFVSIL